MKKVLLTVAALFITVCSFAQYDYEFTIIKENPATSVKDQAQTGTCWCFATISFLESEAIRKGNADTTLDLSEMYLVRSTYIDRIADYYYRRGRGNLGPGAVGHTATLAMQRSGLMTEQAYHGINYPSEVHNHKALVAEIDSLMKVAVKEKSGIPYDEANRILDKYLGPLPMASEFNGQELTPQELREALGLDASEYVEITSFTHHPFYEQVPFEYPDNYEHALYYNVPLDELVYIIDYALLNGFTVSWDSDMSETYFAHNNHLAVFAPGEDIKGSAEGITKHYDEAPIDQDIRQSMILDYTTNDDHVMHMTGIEKDADGEIFYIVKNSWGPDNGDGYLNVSVDYVKAKTVAIMVHKDAVPQEIREKLGF